jgi:hypothetical protein
MSLTNLLTLFDGSEHVAHLALAPLIKYAYKLGFLALKVNINQIT